MKDIKILKVKDAYDNRILTRKVDGVQVLFNGTYSYSQKELQDMFTSKFYSGFIEETDDNAPEYTVEYNEQTEVIYVTTETPLDIETTSEIQENLTGGLPKPKARKPRTKK